jgi:Outer membrane protein beta-barrel domain
MNRRQIVSTVAAALLVAALVPASASAQSFQAGAKGGFNIATIGWSNSDPKPTISSRNGGIIGGYVAKDGKKMGLAVEVLYSQKGAHLDFSSTGFINTADLKLDYVEIPVLFRFNIPNDKTVIHIYAGPVFAFSVKDEITNTFRTTTQTTPATVTTDDAGAKSSDTGIAIGAQVDVHKFLVDVRYNWGLMNVNDDSSAGQPKVKNKCFSLMFGYRFK